MNSRQIQRFAAKHLLPHLPGMRIQGRLLYRSPIAEVLHGCYVEGSGFSKGSITLHAFVQPLYVPAETIVLSFGRRLGRGAERWWDFEREAEQDIAAEMLGLIHLQAHPLFDRIPDSAVFARRAAADFPPPDNEHLLEASAYSNILAGDYPAARELLDTLVKKVRRWLSDIPWAVEMASRAGELQRLLPLNSGAAVEQLHVWRIDTLRNLRLLQAADRAGELKGVGG